MSPACRRVFFFALCFIFGVVRGRAEQVVISEIMYHPAGGKPAWVEVLNNTATPFDIANWRLSAESMGYELPAFSTNAPKLTFLNPFERIVVGAVEPAALRAAWNIPDAVRIYGPWTGKLKHSGNKLVVRDKNGVNLCVVEHEDEIGRAHV